MILCLIFSITGVSASDVNTTDNQVLSATPDIDTLSASVNTEQNNNTQSVNENELLSAAENNNILGGSNTGSSEDFNELIKLTQEKLSLTQDYYFTSTVNIGKNIVIDGNNHIITGNGALFNVDANNVTIENLNINNTQNTDSGIIIWNGDNGKMNNVNFENINANIIVKWNGNSGLMDTIYFNNINAPCIINWTGHSGHVNNMIIEKLNQQTCLYTTSNLFTINNLNKSDNEYRLLLELDGDEESVYNSNFNNTQIQCMLKTYIVNSKFNNFTPNSADDKIFMDSGVGSYTSVSYCDFTYIHNRFFDSTRQDVIFDHNRVINCSVSYIIRSGVNTRAGIFAIKDYFTVSNCYFENITGVNDAILFGGGFKVYNTTVKSSVLDYMFRFESGNGIFSDCLISNCTFVNNTLKKDFFSFVSNSNPSLHVIGSNFTNNTMKTITVADNSPYFADNTFDNNIITSGDYVLDVAGANMYVVNNDFTNNKGFSTTVLNIGNNNQYSAGLIRDNIDKNGKINNNVTNTTDLNNYRYADKLYVSVNGKGSGFDESDRCNWTTAMRYIVYGGTLYLENGIYDFTNQQVLECNVVGQEDGVIINGGSFRINSFNTYLKNLTFNDSSSYLYISASGFTLDNCTFDNITLNSAIFSTGTYSYAKGLTFKNITIKNSQVSSILQRFSGFTAVSYVFDTFDIIESDFTDTWGIFGLPGVNGYTIKNINLTKVKAPYALSLGNAGSYGYSPGAINYINDVNINNCTLDSIMIANNVNINHFYIIRDVTANDVIINNNAYALFIGNNFDLDNIVLNNISNKNVTFVDFCTPGSLNHVSINLTNLTYLIAFNNNVSNTISSLNNVNLTNVNITSILPSDSFNSYNNLNFTNVTFNNDDVIFVLNQKNVLSGCVFDNVTGHILVLGDSVIITGTEFKNMNNPGLNGSCIFVDANSLDLNNLTFTGNTASNGAIYFTNTSLRPSLTGSVFEDNIAVNAGGALYIQESVGDFYITIDDSTNVTINQTYESMLNSGRINGIGGKLDFSALLTDVYVTNDSSAEPNNGKSWDTPTIFSKAHLIAGKNCVFHFVENNVINYSEYQGSYIVSTGDSGWNFIGNNTTFVGIRLIVSPNHTYSVSNVTYKDTNDSAITVNGDGADIIDCKFVNCTGSESKYGALLINASDVNIKNCDFINNTIDDANDLGLGAGIYINGSNIKLDGCHFENNSAMGGAHIYLEDGQDLITIVNNKFINGTTIGTGMSNVRLSGDNVVFYNNTLQYNKNKYALSLEGIMRLLNVSGNTFEDNAAGGLYAVYINNIAQIDYISGNIFINNSAVNGGAWYINLVDDLLNVKGNVFYNNSATGDGGAIYNNIILSLNNCIFEGNNATNGGAIYNNKSLVDTGSVYVYNNATRDGGAIYSKSDLDYTAASSTSRDFVGNRAVNGGALYINGTNNNIRGAYFYDNYADYGSCIYVENNTDLNIYDTQIVNNHVTYGSQVDGGHGDIYLGNVVNFAIPDDALYLEPKTTGSSEYTQYIYNSTNMVRSDVLYVSKSGTGLGLMSNDPTTLEKAFVAINDNGRIVFVESYMLNTTNITRNVTLAGYNNTISIKRNNTTDKNKYLFNPLKKH